MLTLIIQILQERRFCGLTTAESLKRELVHRLAIGDATHSQLVKSLPRDLSKFDQLQEILDAVAMYSHPSGFNQVCFVSQLSNYFFSVDLFSMGHPNFFFLDIIGYVFIAMVILERTRYLPPSLELTRFASC